MKNLFKTFILLIIFFINIQFIYADIPWIECKINWTLIYSWEWINVNNCYFVNNNIIKSWDKLFFLNSLNILENDCFEKEKKEHHLLNNYKNFDKNNLEKWKIYTFRIINSLSQENLPDSFIAWVWERWFYSNIKKDCWEILEYTKINENLYQRAESNTFEYIIIWILLILNIYFTYSFVKLKYKKS